MSTIKGSESINGARRGNGRNLPDLDVVTMANRLDVSVRVLLAFLSDIEYRNVSGESATSASSIITSRHVPAVEGKWYQQDRAPFVEYIRPDAVYPSAALMTGHVRHKRGGRRLPDVDYIEHAGVEDMVEAETEVGKDTTECSTGWLVFDGQANTDIYFRIEDIKGFTQGGDGITELLTTVGRVTVYEDTQSVANKLCI